MYKHPRRLAAAGISPARYDELKAICEQYQDYKRRARHIRAGITDVRPGDGRWRRPDPTGNRAANVADQLAWIERRTRAIEQSAAAVAVPPVARAILRNVTRGDSWERMSPPCGQRQFYARRLDFFIALDAAIGRHETV